MIVLLLVLIIAAGRPLYAFQEYKKDFHFLQQKISKCKRIFQNVVINDALNPEYSSSLAEVYFALYQQTK
ncbi:MAG: hypothetical protein LBS81_00585 [Endomicrobium sp.]|nr:hypothetical protein [Endomicrobium sp.]